MRDAPVTQDFLSKALPGHNFLSELSGAYLINFLCFVRFDVHQCVFLNFAMEILLLAVWGVLRFSTCFGFQMAVSPNSGSGIISLKHISFFAMPLAMKAMKAMKSMQPMKASAAAPAKKEMKAMKATHLFLILNSRTLIVTRNYKHL